MGKKHCDLCAAEIKESEARELDDMVVCEECFIGEKEFYRE